LLLEDHVVGDDGGQPEGGVRGGQEQEAEAENAEFDGGFQDITAGESRAVRESGID
jgi:hypothetical protein